MWSYWPDSQCFKGFWWAEGISKNKNKKKTGHKQKKKVQNVSACNILLLKHLSHGFQFFFFFQFSVKCWSQSNKRGMGNIWRTVVLEAAVYRCSIQCFKYFEKISHKHLWSSCYEMFSWETSAQKSYFSQYLLMHASNFFHSTDFYLFFFLVLDSCKFLFPPNLLDLTA